MAPADESSAADGSTTPEDSALAPLVDGPLPDGRVFRAERRVRLGDVNPAGEARLDALVRWLQDVASDDVRDAGVEDRVLWVVRRTTLKLVRPPRYNRPVELVTWCSGVGPAWAERRTTIMEQGDAVAEAASLWVSLDPATKRPVALGPWFYAAGAEAARGRPVKARLVHARPPAPPLAARRLWSLRQADFDVLGHLNNAIAWVAIEEELARHALAQPVAVAEVEYRAAVETAEDLTIVTAPADRELSMWLEDPSGAVMASAMLRAGGSG